MRATTKEQGFYSQIFKLVLPIVIQNLLSAAVNSADVVMLNYVGQSAISAVSLASNYANVLFMVYYGLGTGATLLCAQYFGKGNMRAIQTVAKLIVLTPFVRITQHAIGFCRLFKFCLGLFVARVHIRMVFLGQFTVCFF